MSFAALYLPTLPGRSVEKRAQLLAVAREFSPRVERVRDDLCSLDVTGLGHWFDSPRALGEAVRRAAADRGLAAHVAVAATRTAAVLLARGRAGLTVAPPGEEAADLSSLPLRVLETFAGESFTDIVKRWGVKTVGEFAGLPTTELSERLGQVGVMWQQLARGEDLQPLVPVSEEEPFEETIQLDWPLDQLEPLSFVLGRLCESLCVRLEQADRGVALLHVRYALVTREPFVRTLQLPAPIRDARTLRTLAMLDLESHPAPAAIDRVTVSADVVEGRVLQFSLLERALPVERTTTLLARLSALMGTGRVGSPALVDSHRPGAFTLEPFEVSGAPASDRAGVRGSAPAQGPRRNKCAILGVEAPSRRGATTENTGVFEGGATPPGGMDRRSRWRSYSCAGPKDAPQGVRRFRRPIPARVELSRDMPRRVTSHWRHLRGGEVVGCAGPWRSSGDWWHLVDAARWDRDEWDVTLRDGGRYVIFRDRQRDRWFIDGILD